MNRGMDGVWVQNIEPFTGGVTAGRQVAVEVEAGRNSVTPFYPKPLKGLLGRQPVMKVGKQLG